MSKKKKSKTKGNKLSSRQLSYEILRIFRREPKKQLNPKQVAQKLKVVNNRDSIQYAMDQLVDSGKLESLQRFKYKLKRKPLASRRSSKLHTGTIDMTRTGSGYVICEDLEDDVFVNSKNMNTALHKDKVQISVWIPKGRSRPEGEVVKVIDRARESFIGTLWLQAKHAVVYPDGNSNLDIHIDYDHLNEAQDGEKVVVKITDWQFGNRKGPLGEITTVLGKSGSSDIEMKAILINNGFNLDFPEAVQKEADRLEEAIESAEIEKRLDIRDVITFTIDPDTAKDFDDALSIKYLESGDLEVGIHIADVSHYVREGSSLDKEALERSTSVYLVDRVLPMLPEKLSNELCSLRPNEDKLTFSAIFKFDNNMKITERWFGRTIIHSDRRFTYEEAQEVLETGEGDFAAELKQLNRLAKKLRKDKFKNGAIAFESPEVKFRLDEQGAPIEIYSKERKDAHMLIEDFMLLANKEVAFFIDKKGKDREIPFVYRIHDEPNIDRVIEFALFAKQLGFEMNISTPKEIGRSYNKLVETARTDTGLKILEPIAIRTMAKAAYSSDNIGHYGLGFDFYSHFTSPIRRYSDVLVHRLLAKNLEGKTYRTNKEKLEEKCEHISQMERKAMDAERESIKYKQVEFIEKHIGRTFPGYISGISDRGLFIALKDTQIEGMVSFETMSEGFEITESRYHVKGNRTGKEYKMGDEVQVKISSTDLSRRRVDMVMEE